MSMGNKMPTGGGWLLTGMLFFSILIVAVNLGGCVHAIG